MNAEARMREDLALSEGYHSPQLEVSVRLNANESPFPPPQGWVEALAEEVRFIQFNRYPDRRAWSLRAAIGEVHGVGPERIFCGNGSNEVLQCVLMAFGGAGRKAVVFEPTYALHSHIARLTGTEVVSGSRRADFLLDADAATSLVSEVRPAVTFLCSPNNPTGRVETTGTVGAVLDSAPGLLVVDEAYGQFSPWSALGMLSTSERLVVVRTFSKTWSMAAARLGYAVASEEVVAALEHVALPYHLDALKQAAGRLALHHEAEMRARVSAIVEERGKLTAGLAGLPVEQWPSDANFILFRPIARDAASVWRDLVARDVLVRDCSSWRGLEGCLRVTVGTPSENHAFLDALEGCLS